ncbi:ubiquinone biosynthesis protein COQ4 [Novosphingobium aromaticivorans]|nr:ubiquinone biosynthesis protein COQ4 [Novosphingobium aromaticivorans]
MNAMTGAINADLPLYDERRPEMRMRPLKAWHHFRKLLRDKENTEEVFYIFEALPWRNLRAKAERFLRSERGQALRAKEPYLPAILDDHAALRAMPAGSLAHAYCDFMEREGLSAQGLVDEFEKFASKRERFEDQFLWYLNRMRDVHDMLHVLTGYGRDALGEACVLAFTYSQQPSPAHLFIGYLAGMNINRQTRRSAPVLRAVREGQRLGKACPRLCEQSITELLPLPIEEVRRRLNITPAERYREAHTIWSGMGIDPYDLLGKNASKLAA